MLDRWKFAKAMEGHSLAGATPQPIAKIRAFEQKLEINYPEIYVDLVLKHASLWVEGDANYRYMATESGFYESDGIGFLFHFDESAPWLGHAPSIYSVKIEGWFEATHIVPFSSTELGNLLSFDFRRTRANPPVVSCNPFALAADETVDTIVSPIAPSFEAFYDLTTTKEIAMHEVEELNAKIWAEVELEHERFRKKK